MSVNPFSSFRRTLFYLPDIWNDYDETDHHIIECYNPTCPAPDYHREYTLEDLKIICDNKECGPADIATYSQLFFDEDFIGEFNDTASQRSNPPDDAPPNNCCPCGVCQNGFVMDSPVHIFLCAHNTSYVYIICRHCIHHIRRDLSAVAHIETN